MRLNLLSLLLITISYTGAAYAQKLPNIQQSNLRAPKDIIIDGKTTEWNNRFQAYNHATDLFYTLSNDDENLYLIIHATDPDVLTKITNRGVVFRVDVSAKKNDVGAATVTFPIFELQYANKPYLRFSNTGQLARERKAAELNPDSVSRVSNKKLHDNEKFIRTSGITNIDTLLSVYNREGIKVSESFDNTMAYTYELSIPLKYLHLSITSPRKFSYHILLPGLNIDKDFGLKTTKGADGVITVSFAQGAVAPTKEHLEVVTSTTDFWGEYVLAQQ